MSERDVSWVLRLTACLRFAMLIQMPLALRKHTPRYMKFRTPNLKNEKFIRDVTKINQYPTVR